MQKENKEPISDRKQEQTLELKFQHLVEKYQERLYWHIRKIVLDHNDADDVLQNTFIKVWKNLDKFREESGALYVVV